MSFPNKNQALLHTPHFGSQPHAENQKKSNEPILRKQSDRRMNERQTYGHTVYTWNLRTLLQELKLIKK